MLWAGEEGVGRPRRHASRQIRPAMESEWGAETVRIQRVRSVHGGPGAGIGDQGWTQRTGRTMEGTAARLVSGQREIPGKVGSVAGKGSDGTQASLSEG